MSLAHTLGSAQNGGAEAYFVSLVGAFARAGLKQSAAMRAHAGREAAMEQLGIPTRVLPFAQTFDFTTTASVAAMAQETNARVILAWMNRAASRTPAGPWARIGRLGGYYKLKNYRGFDALVGNTRDIVAWMVREGWPAERARYIPNFAIAGEGEPIARAALGTPEGVPLLLGMGRLHASKAHDVSLRALALLPQAYLWIAGDGPEEAALKALARELGVSERVRFLGWRDDAASLYRTADVCVFPSRFEPFGNVVTQAWAHRTPIVAAASAGPSANMCDGEDGFLVAIDDVAALADRIKDLMASPSLRATFAEAGAKRIETEFSESMVVAQWRDLFAAVGGA